MLLIILLVFLLLYFRNSKSAVKLFIIIQIVSIAGIFFIGKNFPIDTGFKFFNVLLTFLILVLIISPWSRISNINTIFSNNPVKIKKLTNILLYISIVPFITFSITSFFVITRVTDINEFKYSEGVITSFYNNLPFISAQLIALSSYLYLISFFLIPLHFYYLSKGLNRLSILCLLFSLNIILFGLTYFSRVSFIIYSFTYISMFIILRDSLKIETRKAIIKGLILFGAIVFVYFISITIKRFGDDDYYANIISSSSLIKDPVHYSYIDYLSQGYYNGMYLLNEYKGQIFNGQLSFQSLLNTFGNQGIIRIFNFDTNNYYNLRKIIWPNHYYTFNGLAAYLIYDFGYLLAIIFSLIYYLVVVKLRPQNKKISITNLFVLVLLVQLPHSAIFYSSFSAIVLPLFIYFGIKFYLRL